ncbi:HEPN domain-containing protein [Echinicola vietnamensis]|uniref:HEPN domain-containing protein n=1 Tax=Echinicola vietnamensis (strain DSM 17526 / LMG 23754 / KMM 6221) TaxID=926556 RepID=L0FVE5_ECHVK|nr:HEPN domain-containing protein [Echinicola vietnamensis]AGA76731.1 HEPN domain-containing protein [Echinicola vietnamensis DSM 17526]
MEKHSTYKITKDDLVEIQQNVEAKALFWVEPIPFEGKTFPPLLLVALPNGGTLSIKRAREKITATDCFPKRLANLGFCHFQGMKAGMKRGGLFHLLHFSKKRLVSPGISLPFQEVSKSLLENKYAEFLLPFDVFAHKAIAFQQGALDCWEKRDFTTAAFMFHQAIELGFHASEVFALGKAKQSHKLYSHILSAEYYAPAIADIFLEVNHQTVSPIPLLEKAYLGARYRTNFNISEEDIADLPDLVEEFLSRLFQLPDSYKTAITAFTPQPVQSPTKKSTVMESIQKNTSTLIKSGLNENLQSFLKHLASKFDIEYVYCFGIQAREAQGFSPFMFFNSSAEPRYDLLIISAEPDTSPIQEFCMDAQASGIGVFAIVHHKKEVDDGLKKESRFFNTIVQNGQLFYGNPDGLDFKVITPDYKYIIQGIRTHWDTRNKRASQYFYAAECSKNGCPEVVMFLIHLGLEQLALGIIYTYMGYIPKFRSLSYLFSLCGNFTSGFSDLFQSKEFLEKELLKSLCSSFSGARFRSGYRVDPSHVSAIFDRIPKLNDRLRNLHEEKIKQLELNGEKANSV